MSFWSKLIKKNTPANKPSDEPNRGSKLDRDADFGMDIRIAYSNSEGAREEQANLLDCLQKVLIAQGLKSDKHERHLSLDSGLKFYPRMESFQPIHPRGVHTVTTVQALHDSKIPIEIFEFQHSNGDNLEQSLTKGFSGWASCDLPVLLDLVNEKLDACMSMELKAPANDTKPASVRRILLGPPVRAMLKTAEESEEHCFCPCCLLTNSFDAFKQLIEGDELTAVRFFAARDSEGVAKADCRINGLDFDAGKEALIKYVATWPGTGFEFRKQYVVFEPRKVDSAAK